MFQLHDSDSQGIREALYDTPETTMKALLSYVQEGNSHNPQVRKYVSCREKAELFKSYFALFFATKKNDADCAEWNIHHQQSTEARDRWEDSKVP